MSDKESVRRAKPKRTLDQFVQEQQVVKCKVCALSPAVMAQIKARSIKAVQLPVVLEWLRAEYGVSISPKEWLAHGQGRHETRGKQ